MSLVDHVVFGASKIMDKLETINFDRVERMNGKRRGFRCNSRGGRVAERIVGSRGKTVSVYLSYKAIETLDGLSRVFNISRSDVLEDLIEANQEVLKNALLEKANSLLEETNRKGEKT